MLCMSSTWDVLQEIPTTERLEASPGMEIIALMHIYVVSLSNMFLITLPLLTIHS
jgi:hypothetical protein